MRAAFICISLLCVLFVPRAWAFASWSVGLGGGFTDGYRYLSGGGYPSIAASKALSNRVSIQLESSYLSFGSSYQRARFLPLALGIRFLPVLNPEVRGKPYLQVSPALVVAQLKTHYTTFMLGTSTVDRGFTEILPGAIAGAGIAGPIAGKLNLDLGLRYLWSAHVRDPEQVISGRGRLKGLSQVSVTTALALAL